jgi:hypothetical protein
MTLSSTHGMLLHLLRAGFGTTRSSGDVRLESAKGAKADIDQVTVADAHMQSDEGETLLPFKAGFAARVIANGFRILPCGQHQLSRA